MKLLIQSLILLFGLSAMTQAADIRLNQSVNINKASAEQIAKTLDGIGMSKAKAIVEYRRVNGAFKSVQSLAIVKGIGEQTIAANKKKIRTQ